MCEVAEKGNRELLPGEYESKYKSEKLKEKIVDDGMWALIPAVKGGLKTAAGKRRLRENDLLFSFIDEFVADVPYDFEPNMRDGRFVFVPGNVSHQGIGLSVSGAISGFLEVAHFWYPSEYMEKPDTFLGGGQVYVCNFMMRPSEELAQLVRRVYVDDARNMKEHYCTFPFDADTVVTLKGNFIDHKKEAIKLIRDSLKDKPAEIKRNGEGLIMFMQRNY